MPWSAQVKAALDKALGDDSEIIGNEITQGRAWCWCFGGLGYLVCRWDIFPGCKELVVVAGQGRGLMSMAPFVMQFAKANQADSVRTHSKNPAVGRLWRKYGFKLDEYVFKAVISGQ